MRPDTSTPARDPRRRGLPWFALAAAAGTLHGAVSAYWALGGTWLFDTVGRTVADAFRDALWIIGLVAAAKLAAAIVPLAVELARDSLPRWLRAAVRAISWLGAIGLIGWALFGIIGSQLALAGVVDARPDPDIPSLIGHAWLWDPLFLVWGVALLIGLIRSRPRAVQRASGRHP